MENNHIPQMQTILCIPGNWGTRADLIAAIIDNNPNEYIFAGNILLNTKTQTGFEMQVEEMDPRMEESFAFAGKVNQVSDAFLEEIGNHSMVIYLLGNTGNTDGAFEIAKAAAAILKAGGIGVKVETAGKAFTKTQWLDYLDKYELGYLYPMYVLDSISDGHGTVYTCGMHNLGLKDAIIVREEFQSAVEMLSIFGFYQLIDQPTIKAGQTFSIAQDAPIFLISEEKHQPSHGDELFENPFGMWRLERMQ